MNPRGRRSILCGPRPDKQDYTSEMRRVLENTDHLTIRQAEISEILTEPAEEGGEKKRITRGEGPVGRCVPLPGCGAGHRVYLGARCVSWDVSNPTGPNGLQAANHLTDSLKEHGIEMYRFKTGTPARLTAVPSTFQRWRSSLEINGSFRFPSPRIRRRCREQVSCWLTYTNEKTHEIIRENLDRSPLFSGPSRDWPQVLSVH